jgi:hypothetical protein
MRILGRVTAYALPECKPLKIVPIGSHPEWLTIPPGGKTLHVAVAGDGTVRVVDNQTLEIVKKDSSRCRAETQHQRHPTHRIAVVDRPERRRNGRRRRKEFI